jgi:hypothetical protein
MATLETLRAQIQSEVANWNSELPRIESKMVFRCTLFRIVPLAAVAVGFVGAIVIPFFHAPIIALIPLTGSGGALTLWYTTERYCQICATNTSAFRISLKNANDLCQLPRLEKIQLIEASNRIAAAQQSLTCAIGLLPSTPSTGAHHAR